MLMGLTLTATEVWCACMALAPSVLLDFANAIVSLVSAGNTLLLNKCSK